MKKDNDQNKEMSQAEFLKAIQSCHSVRDTKAERALANIEEIKRDLQKIRETENRR
jgi:hypothetical protein